MAHGNDNTSTRDRTLAWLERHRGEFVSGAGLARELGISRNSVWKAIESLAADGHRIERVTGRGYRLAADSGLLSAAAIERFVEHPDVHIEFHRSIDSTNDRCKLLAEQGAPQGVVVVADEQTAGRGRQGRAFFSPAGSGIYFTLLARPRFSVGDIALVTCYTATVVAHAMAELFDVDPQIKWVNDIFVSGRKACGILSEASLDAESGAVAYIAVGIGINVFAPADGFPAQIARAVSALAGADADAVTSRAHLVARIADLFFGGLSEVPEKRFLDDYRRRSMLDGRDVLVQRGEDEFEATVVGVNDDLSLAVRLADGTRCDLASGEVHIPTEKLV